MKCADLLQQDHGVAEAALQHPFLQACSEGTIRPSQFNTWLEQDFNFVSAFANFAGRVRAVAPHSHARVYIDGSAALSEELTWFKASPPCSWTQPQCNEPKLLQGLCTAAGSSIIGPGCSKQTYTFGEFSAKEKLKERNLLVRGPLHATCAAYIDLLAQFEQQSYAVQAVAFWLIEYVYYKAWNLASPVAEPYMEFADRWGNAEFSKYVDILEQQADEAIQDADQKEQASIKEAALAILIIEQRFWQMAMEAA